MTLTADQVLALAPDGASASAGKKLADSRHWKGLACDERSLWGECQGSALYQVRVDKNDLAAKCSCPSRKFPCKHAIALLLLSAQSGALFIVATAPEWVTDWLDKRGATAAAKEKRESQPAKPVDEVAQAKRAERREERVREGLEALDLWMNDLVRNGLASIEGETASYWEARAARLVDAQAPALASRIRRLGGMVGRDLRWPEAVLTELGKIALLTEAYKRIETLPLPLQSDVRFLLGWTLTQDEVVASGDLVTDTWFVMGSVVEEEERFRAQRSWLLGEKSGRRALVLQFSAGSAAFPELIVAGTTIDADLAFWPRAFPTRAIIHARRASGTSFGISARLSDDSIEQALSRYADMLAANPWVDRFATLLGNVVVQPGDPFLLIDRRGHALPLKRGEHWILAALSGGHPLDVAAEWNGTELLPLAAMTGDSYHLLAGT